MPRLQREHDSEDDGDADDDDLTLGSVGLLRTGVRNRDSSVQGYTGQLPTASKADADTQRSVSATGASEYSDYSVGWSPVEQEYLRQRRGRGLGGIDSASLAVESEVWTNRLAAPACFE